MLSLRPRLPDISRARQPGPPRILSRGRRARNGRDPPPPERGAERHVPPWTVDDRGRIAGGHLRPVSRSNRRTSRLLGRRGWLATRPRCRALRRRSFAVASRRHDATLHLDPAALSDRWRDVLAFREHCAHAQSRAVSRRAAAALPALDRASPAFAEADLSGRRDPGETSLARLLARPAPVVSTAATARAPRHLAAHLATPRQASVLNGTEAKISHNYALLMKKREIQPKPGSDW